MLILFLKAEQLGLLDKIVPIHGAVRSDGTVVAPHYGIRHVRPKEPAKAQRHAEPDLFGDRPSAPVVVSKPKAAPPKASGDLFDSPPARIPLDQKTAETSRKEPETVEKISTDSAPVETAGPAPLDVDKPFDPAAVPDWGVPAGIGKEERRRINAQAAQIMDRGGDISDADRAVLRQYSGNGGCGDSLNEYYTDPKVAASIWFTLDKLGLPPDATALEPSCATGVFLATAPAGVSVTGVELDPLSAAIGAALNPRHDVQNASLERFARQDTRQFDVVIGNAPFGLRGSLLKDDKPKLKTAEAYFIDTSLDKTKDGGIVAMIVPTGVMDGKNNRAFRESVLRKAEFVGALRMPNTAFEHSHTEVTTDVVFLRKRPTDVAGALGTVDRKVLDQLGLFNPEFVSGGYFTGSGAGNVLGTMTEGWRAKAGLGDDITVEGSMVGVPAAIAEFRPPLPAADRVSVQDVLAALGDDEAAKQAALTGALKVPYSTGKAGDTKIVDGIEYVLQGSPLRWHRVDQILQTPAVTEGQNLAAEIERLMTGQTADRPELEKGVRAFVEKHGIPAKNPEILLAATVDKSLYRLIGAVQPDGRLSDVVTGTVAAPAETSFEAAATSLSLELGSFTPEQVAGRWHDGDAEVALDHLYASPAFALNPDGTWSSLDSYLSGELWPKLDLAREKLAGEMAPEDRKKFERQARKLEETIDPKSLEDVEVNINSAFIPLDVLTAFYNHRLDEYVARGGSATSLSPMTISFDKGVYHIGGGMWGDGDLLGKYLNRTGVRKEEDLPKIIKLNREFKAWLCASPDRDRIEDLYNRSFRGFRQLDYSSKPFQIPGLANAQLNPYQYSGLRWALAAGKGIIAADVGLGKTVRGLMLARMAKVNGNAKKPIIIVPKSVAANWLAEAEQWFPGSRCLVIGETYSRDKDGKLKGKPDTATERNRKYHDLTQNDYDFVFITMPAWNDLDLDPVRKGEYASQDFWAQRGASLGNAGDKRLNKIRESHAQALAAREFGKRTDAIYFDDLGVDMLIHDEMHADKNLYAAKNRFGETPKFLGGQGLSNRALDMFFKSRWVRENNGGNNVYGLTATPTKNSPLEIYSMLSFIAPEAFERIGIRNSEEFIDRFCSFRTENILGTDGKIQEALVTVGFKNMGELREIMRRYIDRKTAADVGLVIPEADQKMHLVDMTQQQKLVYANLREKAEKAKSKDATGDAHIFSIMSAMGKAAMDLELYDPSYVGAESPKYDAAVKEIVAGAREGGQVVFAENVMVHHKLRDRLIAAGMSADRIAIINAQEAPSSAQRQNVSDALNAGKIDVVIGNVTMSEGVNMQKRTTDLHHLDIPWDPATLQQRNGRAVRQGNRNKTVRLHTYLAKGSFDGYRYQSMMAKRDWMDLLWNGGDRIENLSREGALSREDLMIMLSDDPEQARKQYDANKTAAMERFTAEKHSEAAGEFVRFAEMKRNFANLKDKKTKSADRLRIMLERSRANLEGNEWFKAKGALDRDDPVLVHPKTGVAFHAGLEFDLPAGDDSPINGGGKFVVSGVDLTEGRVMARPYGAPFASKIHLGNDELEHVTAATPHDATAENRQVEAAEEAAAESQVGAITKFAELKAIPAAVIRRNYASVQQQLHEGAKTYKIHFDHSDRPMIGADGKPAIVESYHVASAPSDQEFMLPIPEHREKAIEAYIAAEHGREFTSDYIKRGRSSQSDAVPVFKYAGKFNQKTNPWEHAGKSLFGDTFPTDARAELTKRQLDAVKKAPTVSMALQAAVPLIETHYGDARFLWWPRKALAMLWAKAKQKGGLDQKLAENIPLEEQRFGAPQRAYKDWVFGLAKHPHSKAESERLTVGDALIKMAERYPDLQSAMIVSKHRKAPLSAVEALARMANTKIAGAAIKHLVDKHPSLAGQVMPGHYGGTVANHIQRLERTENPRDAA